jgi:hypothetical protein
LPDGASGLLVRGYKGKGAERLVPAAPGVVSLLAELRDRDHQPSTGCALW